MPHAGQQAFWCNGRGVRTGRRQSVSSMRRMKGERAAMTALCMVMRSPATSNAKSHQGASSRLHSQRTLWDFSLLPQQPMKPEVLPFLLCINSGPCVSTVALHRGWVVSLAATLPAAGFKVQRDSMVS